MKCRPPNSCTTPGFVKAPSDKIAETVVFLPFKSTVSNNVISFMLLAK